MNCPICGLPVGRDHGDCDPCPIDGGLACERRAKERHRADADKWHAISEQTSGDLATALAEVERLRSLTPCPEKYQAVSLLADAMLTENRSMAADVERLRARVADLEQRAALTPKILEHADEIAHASKGWIGVPDGIATDLAECLQAYSVNYIACARLEVEVARLRAELADATKPRC